jgi:tetratricopeptide (TPR) repeat protein
MTDAQLALAEAHRAQGGLDEALAIYQRLEAAAPTNAQLPFLKGVVYRQQKKPGEAAQAFTRALELSPSHLPAMNQLLELRLEQKDFPAARKLVDGLLTRTPQSAVAWFMLAKVHLAQGQTTNAENALLKTIEFDTNSVAAYSILARLYVATGRGTDAVSKLDEALVKAPNNIPSLVQKAMILNALTNYTQAAEAYEKALSLAPQFPLALNNLAYLYSENLGKLDRAYELAAKAHQLAPDSPQTTDTLGWIIYQRGDYRRALDLLAAAAAKLPDEPEVVFHLGMAHYMQGQEKEAQTALQRALELSKDFPGADEARQRLAMLAGDTGAADPQAMVRLERLLAKQPNDPVGLLRLADLQARSGAYDKARASYEQVLKLNPRSVPALANVAVLYAEKLHNPAKALELAKQARSLAPSDPQIGHTAGRVAFQAGDHSWALGALEEAVKQLPKQPEAQADFAWAAYSLGRVPEALDAMRQALKLAPTFARADQARQFLALTETSTNLPLAQAALKSDPDFVPALMVLGAAQADQGNVKEARQTFEKALTRYPNFTPAMKALVALPGGSGDDRRDYDWATKARRAFPTDPQVAKALGRAAFKRGDHSAASRLLKEAVKSLPEDAEAHFYLGAAQLQLGNKAQGQRDLQRASELGLSSDLALEATRLLLETK